MSPTLLSVFVSVALVGGADINRQQVVQLIDAAQEANCRDVSLEYEGLFEYCNDAHQWELQASFTGRFRHRSDGATGLEVFNINPPLNQSSHNFVALLNGSTTTSNQKSDQKNATIAIKQPGPLIYAGESNFRMIWRADQVKLMARSEYVYEFEGFQNYEGSECAVVRFRLVEDGSTWTRSQTLSMRFFVDLQRGGHVVRMEELDFGDKLRELITVDLRQFPSPSGRLVWLPGNGQYASLVWGKTGSTEIIYKTEPRFRSTLHLLPSSVRIDQGLGDEVFTVQPRSGDLISDEIRRARYEFGQYLVRPKPMDTRRRPTDTEIKAEVDRMLGDSERMARELRATTPAQEASVWGWAWPWAVAGGALLGLAWLVVRQRRGQVG